MICIFHDGILTGLQFEIEEPPHRIRAEWLVPIKISVSAAPMDSAYPMETYKRGSDIYAAVQVNVQIEHPSLGREVGNQVIVYELERTY